MDKWNGGEKHKKRKRIGRNILKYFVCEKGRHIIWIERKKYQTERERVAAERSNSRNGLTHLRNGKKINKKFWWGGGGGCN